MSLYRRSDVGCHVCVVLIFGDWIALRGSMARSRKKFTISDRPIEMLLFKLLRYFCNRNEEGCSNPCCGSNKGKKSGPAKGDTAYGAYVSALKQYILFWIFLLSARRCIALERAV